MTDKEKALENGQERPETTPEQGDAHIIDNGTLSISWPQTDGEQLKLFEAEYDTPFIESVNAEGLREVSSTTTINLSDPGKWFTLYDPHSPDFASLDDMSAALKIASIIADQCIEHGDLETCRAAYSFIEKNQTLIKATLSGEYTGPFFRESWTKTQWLIKQLVDELTALDDPDEIKIYPAYLRRRAMIKHAVRALAGDKDEYRIIYSTKTKQAYKERREYSQVAGGITTLPDGRLVAYSGPDTMTAFSVSRFYRVIDPADDAFNSDGLLNNEGAKLVPVAADDVKTQLLMLLTAAQFSAAGSMEGFISTPIRPETIVLPVESLANIIIPKWRTTWTGTEQERTQARSLYVEKELLSLKNIVGVLPNGSRYSVINYYGYDKDADVMRIDLPYIAELYKLTQGVYHERQARLEERHVAGRRPANDDMRPPELNRLFDNRAYTENSTTLEIAIYITNVMLQAGKSKRKGDPKKSEIKYSKIVAECSRLKAAIEGIKADDAGNKTQRVNNELRKISSACKLILNDKKCHATKLFDNISFKPSKGGEVIPPTSNTLDQKLTITWEYWPSDEA